MRRMGGMGRLRGMGGIVILIVDNRTQISKKLQEEIDKGKIKLERKNLNKKKSDCNNG